MKKLLTILLLFWWTFIFPEFSFNSFTTELIDESVNYSDFHSTYNQEIPFNNVEYTTWFETIFLSSNK